MSNRPKSFEGEPLSVSLTWGTEKVWIREGGVSRFSVENFCLTVLKISVGQSFAVAIISGIGKVWIREGGSIKIFRRIFLSHSAEKIRWAILCCCNDFGYRESLDKRGERSIKIFRRKFFVSQCQKFP